MNILFKLQDIMLHSLLTLSMKETKEVLTSIWRDSWWL